MYEGRIIIYFAFVIKNDLVAFLFQLCSAFQCPSILKGPCAFPFSYRSIVIFTQIY